MELAKMTWPAIKALAPHTPIVLPIAALEQHSHHLPVFTDTLLVQEIARRVNATMGDRLLFAPVMWLGNSLHHLEFAGTMSASPRTYLDLLRDMIECHLTHGFRRVVLLNGHGGNSVPAQQALYELRQKYRDRSDQLFLLANYWALGSNPREAIAGLTQPQIQHACQWETAMMLHAHPELVGDLQDLEPVDYGNPFLPANRSGIMRDFTASGHVGDPRAASAEIGAALLDTYAADVTRLLQRVVDWDGRSWSG